VQWIINLKLPLSFTKGNLELNVLYFLRTVTYLLYFFGYLPMKKFTYYAYALCSAQYLCTNKWWYMGALEHRDDFVHGSKRNKNWQRWQNDWRRSVDSESKRKRNPRQVGGSTLAADWKGSSGGWHSGMCNQSKHIYRGSVTSALWGNKKWKWAWKCHVGR